MGTGDEFAASVCQVGPQGMELGPAESGIGQEESAGQVRKKDQVAFSGVGRVPIALVFFPTRALSQKKMHANYTKIEVGDLCLTHWTRLVPIRLWV